MKRVISGIKPTGDLTLGNYLGAIKHWAAMSRQTEVEHFWFIPNLHALNVRPEPQRLTHDTRAVVAWLLAVGVDAKSSYIFAQSQIPAHSEMTWILNNFVTVGELNRMTQFKDKSFKAGAEGQLVGLYDYPVLMAADILLYDADEVPTGDDQKQHVELTRDIATRFNNLYGSTFKVPASVTPSMGARIMDLQHPDRKMSKTDEDLAGTVLLVDDPKTIEHKFIRAVTDSGSVVSAGADKPALSNLLVIASLVYGKDIEVLEHDFADQGYGDFKKALAHKVISELQPLQRRYEELMKPGNDEIDKALEHGWWRASELANAKLASVKELLGLL